MTDYLGKEITIGDTVLTNDIHYRSFVKGTVVKITNKTIRVKVEKANSNYFGGETVRFPSQVVVISGLLKANE